MPTSACCSASTSGVAIRSLDFHSYHAVLDMHRKGVDGYVRGQCQGLAGAQVEQRPVSGALDRAVLGVELTLDQLAVIVRAAVLDGEHGAIAIEDAELELIHLDETLLAGRQFIERADVDQRAHSNPIPEVRILS